MKATRLLHDLGKSIWLDNITRDPLDTGQPKGCTDDFSVTGLTSNPTVFYQAIKNSSAYDATIRAGITRGIPSRCRTADRGRSQPACHCGRVGLHQPLGRRGPKAGSRVAQEPPRGGHGRADLRASTRAPCAAAPAARVLWASTGTKDPGVSEVLYVKALAAPMTVNTMPGKTLQALATHTARGPIMATDGGRCESVLGEFARAGVDVDGLASRLQDEGAKSFVASWEELMSVISAKSAAIK